jgi:hypothetical protein
MRRQKPAIGLPKTTIISGMGSCSWCKEGLEIIPILHGGQPPCLITILAKVLIIEPNFNLILFGHMHAHDVTSQQRNEQGFRRPIQARSLFGIEHYGESGQEDRHFGYSLGHARLEGDSIQLRVWARKLIEKPSWSFRHPEDVGYREYDGQHLAPWELPPSLKVLPGSSAQSVQSMPPPRKSSCRGSSRLLTSKKRRRRSYYILRKTMFYALSGETVKINGRQPRGNRRELSLP